MGPCPGHPRVPGPVPSVVALLLGLAGAAVAEPRAVSGVLGKAAVLSLDLPHNGIAEGIVKGIEWSFSSGTGVGILVAEVGPLGIKRPDPQDRFGDRMEVNETVLRIRDLKWGDSGIYKARIKLYPTKVVDQSFNLSLYEPVPQPEVRLQRRSLSSRECNLTLRCELPAGSAAGITEITWRPRGQRCGDSRTLCLSLPLTARNSSYTCVAGNDIQERSVTVRPGILCDEDRSRRGALICLGVVAGVVGALGIAWVWRKKRRKRAAGSGHGSARDGPDRAALAPRRSRDPSPEALYSEIQRRSPPEPREPAQDNATAVYSLVRV